MRIKAGWWVGLWVALSVSLLLVAGLGYSLFSEDQQEGCSGTVSPIGNGRIRRAHSPVIDSSSGALGAANRPFPSTAGSVASSPIGANDHDATLNGRGARGPAARAAAGTANHGAISITGRAADNAAGGAINTTAFAGRDTVSITSRATDNAAKPSNTAWPDCWRANGSGAHAPDFAGRASPGSDRRGPISPLIAADARGSRYVRSQPTAGPRSAPSPGLLPRACGRDLRAADPRSHPPLPA